MLNMLLIHAEVLSEIFATYPIVNRLMRVLCKYTRNISEHAFLMNQGYYLPSVSEIDKYFSKYINDSYLFTYHDSTLTVINVYYQTTISRSVETCHYGDENGIKTKSYRVKEDVELHEGITKWKETSFITESSYVTDVVTMFNIFKSRGLYPNYALEMTLYHFNKMYNILPDKDDYLMENARALNIDATEYTGFWYDVKDNLYSEILQAIEKL